MDWVITAARREAADRAHHVVVEHLHRHALDAMDVDESAGTLRTHLEEAADRADGRPLHVGLSWGSSEARLRLGAVTVPDDAAGVWRSDGSVPVRHRRFLRSWRREDLGAVTLPVSPVRHRLFDAGPPPAVSPSLDDLPDGQAGVVLALCGAAEAYPGAGASQTALIAGAAIGAALPRPRDAAAVADAFRSAHTSFGSDAEVVHHDDSRVDIAVSECPFDRQKGHLGQSSLCQLSVGIAGQLAARVNGSARVRLDESIARGDHECHLQVMLGDDEEDQRSQPFHSPARATASDANAPHLELSVSLPRESVSVPVVRRLAAQALRAFGVYPDDVDDVQVAISEACGNVIDHADASDTYDVRVDLAADCCTITVIDQGGGFDAGAVPPEPPRRAESGRGLQLMRALVDNVAFRNEPQAGAVVHMVKALRYDIGHPLQRRRPGTQ